METAKDYGLSPKHHERSGKKLDLTECSIHSKEKIKCAELDPIIF
jgi:hypothetical protein